MRSLTNPEEVTSGRSCCSSVFWSRMHRFFFFFRRPTAQPPECPRTDLQLQVLNSAGGVPPMYMGSGPRNHHKPFSIRMHKGSTTINTATLDKCPTLVVERLRYFAPSEKKESDSQGFSGHRLTCRKSLRIFDLCHTCQDQARSSATLWIMLPRPRLKSFKPSNHSAFI